MTARSLPTRSAMLQAIVRRDPAYDGVFITAVRTTGIFCRPVCPARPPKPQNVEFYPSARDALVAGYRPCKRCRPLERNGETPDWLSPLLEEVERRPERRWKDADLRALGLSPSRVRRWFKAHHGMTFHAYQRARRLGLALGQMRLGEDLTRAAYDHGYESLSGFRTAFKQLAGESAGNGRTSTLLVLNRLLTPLGPMVGGATEHGVCLLEFADRPMLETNLNRLRTRLDCVIAPGRNSLLERLDDELRGYFAGTIRRFTVPLVTPGTPFQSSVWARLREIPYGETRTYRSLAGELRRPSAVRAVGRANGDNPVAILVPCHRVVGSDGELRGYGGGLWRKRFLLDHERQHSGLG